ncbi:MAG TPA: penicillin-binding protein 2 [Candidatus Dormibacteraeota bacterium]|nr:penicillin-binding protein 2 [Candidatus Dormibacteraeota bacterium]
MTFDTGRQVRLRMTIVCVGALFAALLARLWYLQVIDHHVAHISAVENGIRYVYTEAPRGLILDRNGNVLVGNVDEPVIDVDPHLAAQHPRTLDRLAALLGMTVPQLDAAIHNLQYSPYAPVPVAVGPSASEILHIQEYPSEFPGVTVGTETVRAYSPAGKAAANIVGYVGRIDQAEYEKLKSQGYQPDSQIGQTGVEATFESVLRGRPGVTEVEVDAQGNVVSTLHTTAPVPGENVRLTIDGSLQEAAVNTLAQETAIKRSEIDPDGSGYYRADSGAVVVEDPHNGQLLALATYPIYDPAQFVGGISQANYAKLTAPSAHAPLEDRAISGEYFPGSTFKLVTATAGLVTGVITPTSLFDDVGGGITVGGHFFANDGHQSYGEVALPFALTVSDDAFFYHIGETLYNGRSIYGQNVFQKVASEYGFSKPTGIDLPGESSGFVLTPQQKAALHRADPAAYPFGSYYTGDAIESAIGEDDVVVTPLQLANAYAAFANGGTLYRPSIVLDAETLSGKVVHSYAPVIDGHTPPLTAAERQAMIAGFVGVTTNPLGTAYGSFGKTGYPIQVAGKTGTAQVTSGLPHTSPAYKQYTSVFTSFAPAQSPRYVVDCFIPQAGYGADAAAPVVRQIYDILFHQPILATPLSGY